MGNVIDRMEHISERRQQTIVCKIRPKCRRHFFVVQLGSQISASILHWPTRLALSDSQL
jgi:hypothetical protein